MAAPITAGSERSTRTMMGLVSPGTEHRCPPLRPHSRFRVRQKRMGYRDAGVAAGVEARETPLFGDGRAMERNGRVAAPVSARSAPEPPRACWSAGRAATVAAVARPASASGEGSAPGEPVNDRTICAL